MSNFKYENIVQINNKNTKDCDSRFHPTQQQYKTAVGTFINKCISSDHVKRERRVPAVSWENDSI